LIRYPPNAPVSPAIATGYSLSIDSWCCAIHNSPKKHAINRSRAVPELMAISSPMLIPLYFIALFLLLGLEFFPRTVDFIHILLVPEYTCDIRVATHAAVVPRQGYI